MKKRAKQSARGVRCQVCDEPGRPGADGPVCPAHRCQATGEIPEHLIVCFQGECEDGEVQRGVDYEDVPEGEFCEGELCAERQAADEEAGAVVVMRCERVDDHPGMHHIDYGLSWERGKYQDQPAEIVTPRM